MNIASFIARYGTYYGDKTAVVDGDKRLSFAQITERVHRLANGLTGLGIKADEGVALIADNCHQFIEIFFARYELGVLEVTLNTRLAPADWVRQLNETGSKTVFVDAASLPNLLSIRGELKDVTHIIAINGNASGDLIDYEKLISSGSAQMPRIEVDVSINRIQRIMYTGGTTGQSKGVMLSRAADLAQLRNMLVDMVPDLTSRDIFMGLQPMYHAVRPFFFPCWMKGSTHVVVASYQPKVAFEAIEKEKVTVIKTVPTVLTRMTSDPDVTRRDLKSVRTIIYGAAPISPEQLKQAIAIFGPVLVQSYGQSESAMTVCRLSKEDHVVQGDPKKVARLASVGRPYSFVEIKLVDDDGNEVKQGELGELCVRGEHNMTGYLNLPEETKKVLKDGWVHTRDFARMDSEGFVFLVDRKGDTIKSGGEFVYPGEVEQVIYQHPAVMEACVFGIPDKQWGESVTAAVALKPGMTATEEELILYCKERLAKFKSPKKITLHESLPKSGAGKILRKDLKEPYWKGMDRRIN